MAEITPRLTPEQANADVNRALIRFAAATVAGDALAQADARDVILASLDAVRRERDDLRRCRSTWQGKRCRDQNGHSGIHVAEDESDWIDGDNDPAPITYGVPWPSDSAASTEGRKPEAINPVEDARTWKSCAEVNPRTGARCVFGQNHHVGYHHGTDGESWRAQHA